MPPRKRARAEASSSSASAAAPRTVTLTGETPDALHAKLAAFRRAGQLTDLTVKARALVLATGAMGRPPSFKGEDVYLGRGARRSPQDYGCRTALSAAYGISRIAFISHAGLETLGGGGGRHRHNR